MSLKEYFIHHRKIFAFLAFLVFAVYLNSLGNNFVSDDIGTINDIITLKNKPAIDQISYFLRLPYSNINFRALINFLTYTLFGPHPAFFRLSNILFHLGSSWIIYLLVGFFFKSPVPLITASIFAVHPILSESVTWISGGVYSNPAFFIFLSLLTYILSGNTFRNKLYLTSVCSFLIGLFFSEKVFIFPLILLLYEFCLPTVRAKVNWRKLIPFLAIGGFWILYLLALVGTRTRALEAGSYQEPGINNPLLQIPIAVTSYLELIFWPKNLTLYHSEMSFTFAQYLLRSGGFILFLLVLLFLFKKNRPSFFWLSFFLITLLPTLTPLRISWIVAERYVYLGALGVFVVIGLLIQKIGEITKNQKISFILLSFILLILSIRTILRNTDWQNQDTLWLATAKISPSSPQNHNNLGDYYGRHGNLEKAVEEFKKAIELKPNYGDAYHNLANTYQLMGKTEEALDNYQKAISFNPNLWQSYQNLAAIYFNQGKYDLVLKNLAQAVKINPQNSNLYTNLGIVYLKLGEKLKAEEKFKEALNLNPQDERARVGLLELMKLK